MAARVILIKHLCQETINFKDNRLAFNSILLVNVVVLICTLPYWLDGHFDQRIFWIGFACSLFDTLGKVCLVGGISNGPSGPVSALTALDGVETFLLQAILAGNAIRPVEVIGLILSFVGALILVIPDLLMQYLCCCLNKKSKEKVEDK